MVRDQNSLIANVEKTLTGLDRRATSHSIPLGPGLLQNKALTLQFVRMKDLRKLQKRDLKSAEVGS